MSFFLLTNNSVKAETAKCVWTDLYGVADSQIISHGMYFVTTSAFRKSAVPFFKSTEGTVYGFGTFFSKAGFGIDALIGEPNLLNFSQEMASRLYGHYVFILITENLVRIVTDPVGLINVHWSNTDDGFIATNDPVMAGGLCGSQELNQDSVHQFVLNMTNIGNQTLFQNVQRLRLGCELHIRGNLIEEKKFYVYNPQKLSYEEYCERIDAYFFLISKYKGVIATDISAGYDSRFVSTCAKESIPQLVGVTNTNLDDYGTDEKTSTIVASALGIPLVCIPRKKEPIFNAPLLLHSLTLGRDIIRSVSMLDLNSKKYKNHGLLLGGYGGEVMRGKYCNYKSIDDFIDGYFRAYQLRIWTSNDESSQRLKSVLEEQYLQNWIETPEQLCNWFYAMDKMRIWGGSCVAGKLVYGDRLHPYMDWYLVEPLFVWDFFEIKNANLMKRLMEKYAPGITRIPINAGHRLLVNSPLAVFYKLKVWVVFKYIFILKVLKRIWRIVFGMRMDLNRIFSTYSKNLINSGFQEASGLSLSFLKKSGHIEWVTRFVTCYLLLDRAKEIQKRETGLKGIDEIKSGDNIHANPKCV